MPHSLRVRLKNLNYKGLLTDRELNRLVNALDTVDSIEDIKAEISRKANSGQWSEATIYGMQKALAIIDKHISGKEQNESKTDS